jgi:hypothetical protein
MRLRITALMLAGAVLALFTAPEWHRAADVHAAGAQLPTGEQTAIEPAAGFFSLSAGGVKAKLVRTQTTSSALTEGAWRPLAGAALSRVVAAGTTDLINLAFSGECQVRSLGNGDAARIRIGHTVNGIQVAPVEPYDGDQRFCSAVAPVATHSAMWATRVGAGSHTFRVEIMPVDFGSDNGALVVTIDDWTFELVVYD